MRAEIDTALSTIGIAAIAEGLSPAEWRYIKRTAVRWLDVSYPRPMARYYAINVFPDRFNVVMP